MTQNMQKEASMTAQRILVLEDHADLRRLYAKVLTKAGYEVYPAATLEEARALLSQGHVDVFVCDIHVGDERGTDLLREQSAALNQQGTKIVVVSGEAQYRPFCEELGIEFYLEKPIGLEMLLTLMKRLTPRQ
jgi:two-component system OmpR family response regulator